MADLFADQEIARQPDAAAANAPLADRLRPNSLDEVVGQQPQVDKLRAGPDVVSPNELEAEELVGHEFYVFLNAESDAVAVIYRRRDGNLGVIEPVRG